MGLNEAAELQGGGVRGGGWCINVEGDWTAVEVELHGQRGVISDNRSELYEPLNAQDDVSTVDGKDVKVHGERRALKEDGSLVAYMGARNDGVVTDSNLEGKGGGGGKTEMLGHP